MTITYEPRASDARALVVALGMGGLIGLAIGGAYIVGGVAREAVSKPLLAQANHVQIPAPTAIGSQASAGPTSLSPSGLSTSGLSPSGLSPSGPPPAALTPYRPRPTSLRDRFSFALGLTRSAPSPLRFKAADARTGDRSRDTQCLAQAVYYEARGESPSGQAAVAQVVLNRVRHPAFPKTVCGVVFQHVGVDCQFSFACNGAIGQPLDRASWRRAVVVADRALNGAVMAEVGEATHFQAARSGTGWAGSLAKVAQIGEHIFYRFSGRAGAAPMFQAQPQRLAPSVEAQAEGAAGRVHAVFKVAAAEQGIDAKTPPPAPSASVAKPVELAAKPPAAVAPAPAASTEAGNGAQPLKAVEAEKLQPITTSATPS